MITICGNAASRALGVSLIASRTAVAFARRDSLAPISTGDLVLAFVGLCAVDAGGHPRIDRGSPVAVVARVASEPTSSRIAKIWRRGRYTRRSSLNEVLLFYSLRRELAFRLTWHQERDFDPAFRLGLIRRPRHSGRRP